MAGGKRILIGTFFHGVGGRETHVTNLCRLLPAHGMDVTVASRTTVPDVEFSRERGELAIRSLGTPCDGDVRWARWSGLAARLLWPLQLRGERFDVLYLLEMSPLTRMLTRFAAPEGFVIWNHYGPGENFTARNVPAFAERRLLNGIIVETPRQLPVVRKLYPASAPVIALPHLANATHYPVRAGYLENGVLRVAFAGRYTPAKGCRRLLDLWGKLRLGPARLDFYGEGRDGAFLSAEVARRKLESSVRVNGPYRGEDGLRRVLGQTDLLVLPSEAEGFPLVLLEAMTQGVPFVAGDVAGVALMAEQNPDVRVVPLTDAALTQALENLGAAIRAGGVKPERLQAYHRERYSYEKLAARWLRALQEPREAFREWDLSRQEQAEPEARVQPERQGEGEV